MAENNSCVICLESLCSADVPIGATVPCGHCFHQECFEGWKKSKLGSASYHGRGSIKCPMCNKQTTDFCRIYLDLSAIDGDDDGNSLTSVEESVHGKDDEEEETDDDKEQQDAPDDDVANDDDDENDMPPDKGALEVICVDDESVDSSTNKTNRLVPSASVRESSGSKTESEQKYRRMAKKLKARVKRIEAERQRQAESLLEISEKHAKVKRELRMEISGAQHVKDSVETLKRVSESLTLDAVRLRRERDEARHELQATKNKVSTTETQMYELRRQYARDVERAHANSMAEVSTILSQHPKLTEANRRLKEELVRKEERIILLESRMRSSSVIHHRAVEPKVDRFQLKENSEQNGSQRASKTAKLLYDFQQQQQLLQQQVTKNPPASAQHEGVQRRMKGKVSDNAARFSRASDKPASRVPSAAAALDAIDQRARGSSSYQPKAMAPGLQKLLLAPRKREKRKFMPALQPAASKPKRQLNDIRHLLKRK